MCYWNIHNVTDKVENDYVIRVLCETNIIWLSAVKSDRNVHLPGYKAFRNSVRYPNHGRITLLIKDNLVEYVNEIKYVNDDITCISFNFMPEITFCGCYSPPSDSKYFDMTVFAEMNSIILDSGNRFVIFGDFNAKVKDREGLLRENDKMNYYTNENNSNINGEYLRSICVHSDLIVLNNLNYYENHFSDLPTFRRKYTWISQLDLCIISKSIINQVTSFDVN